jgi:hypothetical protein
VRGVRKIGLGLGLLRKRTNLVVLCS